jgi:hypothetical protein
MTRSGAGIPTYVAQAAVCGGRRPTKLCFVYVLPYRAGPRSLLDVRPGAVFGRDQLL